MADFYYLNAEQQAVGPMSLEGIRKLVDAGIVDAGVLVCPAGEQEWKPLPERNEGATATSGPPRVPPPPRSHPSASVARAATPSPVSSDWLAPAAMGAGIFSILMTFLPVLAFLIAIPALVGGVLILRRPASPKRGFAFAAVATGALGAAPALLFLIGMIFGMVVPRGGTLLSNPSIEEQIVGAWVAGTEGQFGAVTFGYSVRAVFAPDGSCRIKSGFGFGTALPNDPRGSALGLSASGRWELVRNPERIIARFDGNPQVAMGVVGDEGSGYARVDSTETIKGEVWEFEIRRQGDRFELFSYPPSSNKGYTFVREDYEG